MTVLPWIVALIVLAIDQVSKWLVVTHIADMQIHPVIPHLLQWVFVQNTHGAYGFFGDRPLFLIMIATVAFLVIWLAFQERAKHSPVIAVALGGVLGGAMGNIIDRIHYGFVVDFIRVIPLPIFEVFNIADSTISLGIFTIVVLSLRTESTT